MLRNILGPFFNFYLAQFLTCFFFGGGGAETPIFIVFSSTHAKFKEHTQKKNTLFVNTTVLIALVKTFLIFVCLSIFFERCFF